jgi:selenocysteine-specific elongation factor
LEQLALPDPEEVVLATLRPERRRWPRRSSQNKSKQQQQAQSRDAVKASFGGYLGRDAQEITATTGIPVSEVEEALFRLAARGAVVRAGAYCFVASEWDRLSGDAVALVAAYHQRYALRIGMPREEWRSRLGLSAKAANETLATLVESESLAEETAPAGDIGAGGGHGVWVRLPSHHPHMTTGETEAAAAMLEQFREHPYSPPTWQEVDEALGSELALALLDQGKLVKVSEAIVLERTAYTSAVTQVVSYLQEHETITVAQARDLLGTSRKYMLAILEHLDAQHITRRRGDDRLLGPYAPAAGNEVSSAETDTTASSDG